MDRMGKYLSLFYVVILALPILLMIQHVDAQAIPKPSVPEFTLSFADKSHDVAQTALSTTDPYNNKTTTNTIPGYHVKDFEIEITIQNQQYPSIINGNSSNVYYLVQSKGHFVNWTGYYTINSLDNLSVQSNSEHTKLLYSANTYLPGDQVDFRIKAVLGYTYTSFLPDHIAPIPVRASFYETSDWSTTQTFVMPDTSNPNQISPFLPILVSAIILLLAIAAVFLLVHKRHKKMHLANML